MGHGKKQDAAMHVSLPAQKIHLQTHILVQRFRPSHKKCLNHAEPTYCEVAHRCKEESKDDVPKPSRTEAVDGVASQHPQRMRGQPHY
jgi:hypothetical protein